MASIVVGVIALCAEPAQAQNADSITLTDIGDAALTYRLPILAGLSVLIFALLWGLNTVQPGALKKGGLRDVSPYPWPMWLFAAIIVYVTMAMSQGFVSAQPWITGDDPNAVRAVAAVSIGVYALTLVVAIGMLTLFSRSAGNAGLRAVSGDIPIGALCFVLSLPAIYLAATLLVNMHESITGAEVTAVAHPMLQRITERPSDPWVWALIGAAVIGAPLVEEIMFRGFFQSSLLRWTGMPWIAILITAVVFTSVHAFGEGAVDYYALGPIFVLGLATGLAYERTKRLGVPIVMHMAFNALNIGIALYASNDITDAAMPTQAF